MRKNLFWEKAKNKLKSYYIYLGLLLGLFFILSLARNVSKIAGAGKRIDKAESRVEKLRRENEEIKRKLAEVKGEEYIEKQLRDKLGLAKEGEIVVVLPDEEILRKIAPSVPEEEDVLPDPTWKKWLKLFF
ncbi:septum formation initiator family protein [Candidatus Woesebacteria bacterium]|nr:septum formation initiator family protein [Candidatus Woesebacteria bacterium]